MALLPLVNNCPILSNSSNRLYIFADEGAAINSVLHEMFPHADINNCAWHVSLYFVVPHDPKLTKLLKSAFWDFVRSTDELHKRQIRSTIQTLTHNENLQNKLDKVIDLTIGNPFGITTNSLSECANAVLLNVKHSGPFTYFREFILIQLQAISKLEESLKTEDGRYLKEVLNKIEFSRTKAMSGKITLVAGKLGSICIVYDIQDDKQYQVNIYEKTCSCNRYLRGHPCSHLLFCHADENDFIHRCYQTQYLKQFINNVKENELTKIDLTNISKNEDISAPKKEDKRVSKKRKLSHGYF